MRVRFENDFHGTESFVNVRKNGLISSRTMTRVRDDLGGCQRGTCRCRQIDRAVRDSDDTGLRIDWPFSDDGWTRVSLEAD